MAGIEMYWISLASGIAATVFFLIMRVRRGGVPALIVKAVASLFFITTACAALAVNAGRLSYGLLIIPGLVCGLLGDIWLDLKYVYPKDKDAYLFGGFYSFLTGHFFFIAAIYLNYDWTGTTLLSSVVPALIGIAAVAAMEKPMKLDYGRFRPTCLAYGFVLMTVASSSVVAAAVTGEAAWIVMSAGAVLFLLSDLMLSATYFGQGKDTTAYIVANHLFYYAAQFVIASSLLYL